MSNDIINFSMSLETLQNFARKHNWRCFYISSTNPDNGKVVTRQRYITPSGRIVYVKIENNLVIDIDNSEQPG
jgi:hypothetical protein